MIVTITGPRSVGKSTIAPLVAKKLKLRYISSDAIGEEATKEQGGLDKAIKSGAIEEIIKTKGYTLIHDEYRKDNFVFDLSGGSISATKFPEAAKKVRDDANKHSIVVGLLPSADEKKSVEILFEREKERAHFREMDRKELMEKTIRSYSKFPPLFKEFCHIIAYTEGKTPEQIAEEIVISVKNF